MSDKGDGQINQSPDASVREQNTFKQVEAGAVQEMQKELHLQGPDALKAVKQFERTEDQKNLTPEQVAADLQRIATKLASLTEPRADGSTWMSGCEAHDPEMAKTIKQMCQDTAQLAKQVDASYTSGPLKGPDAQTQDAVQTLLQRLSKPQA